MPDRPLATGPGLRLRGWISALRREGVALYIAGRDPRTPRTAKLLALTVAAYALSPIDLIPDVIPVLGYLDDALLLPLGVLLAVRLIPDDLMEEFRYQAALLGRPGAHWAGGAIILAVWAFCAALAFAWAWRAFG